MSWNRWNNRKRREAEQRDCAELNDDDGIDPRSFFRDSRRSDTRKDRQLCGQIARVLNCVLGESGDPKLYDLMVEQVNPAPDTSHLLVLVVPMGENIHTPPAELLVALGRAKTAMKEEIAASISRKRVPSLSFQVMLPPEATLPLFEDVEAHGGVDVSGVEGDGHEPSH